MAQFEYHQKPSPEYAKNYDKISWSRMGVKCDICGNWVGSVIRKCRFNRYKKHSRSGEGGIKLSDVMDGVYVQTNVCPDCNKIDT